MMKFPVGRLFAIFVLFPIVTCVYGQVTVPASLKQTGNSTIASVLPNTVAQQVLKGHVPPITKKLSSIGRLEGARHLDLSIGLPLRNREALTNLLEQLYQPDSTGFRHYLTPDQFAASFGPSQGDYQKVIDFAKTHGLVVKQTHPNRTLLDVSGSVADIEQAFHLHLRVYQHPVEARTFFAPDAEPTLDLDTPVLAISGLDNYVRPRPHIHPAVAYPQPQVRPMGGGGPGGGGGGGSNAGPFEGYDFRDAYAAGVSQDGTGQTVGLFELFGFSNQDIQDYEDDAGIYPYVNVQPVLVDGASGDDSSVDYLDDPGYIDYGVEVAADIEMAISMAPGLNSVLVYEGPTPQDVPPLGANYIQDATTTAQINDVLNRMATDDLAMQLSCSYGFDINLSTVQIFQQFAAQGQSFFLSSGDAGAFAGAVDEPADDPFITVVGGTTLTMNSSGAWASETTWLTPAGFDEFGDPTPLEASAGGISTDYAIPTWQQGISMAANQGSTTMRNLPDVSLVANNVTVYWGNDAAGTSIPLPEGGTSLAAPLWAGFLAMVNQQAAANGQPPVGFINPAVYAIGKSASYHTCFHDITTGRNTNSTSPTKYSATAGYDLCTGWGTMIGGNLMSALLAPPSETLLVTPPLGFASFGPGGGPFTAASQTYTLQNIGAKSLNWSLVNTSSWLSVTAVSGNLNAGASTTVTVSLNSNAKSFLITHASGNVVLNNLTAGTAQNRQFDLYVGNGGFETGGLDDWTLAGSTELVFSLAADDVDVAGSEALDGQPDGLFVRSGIYGAYLGEWAWGGYPAVGSLSQTVATEANQPYLVSFWFTCVPDDQGDTTNNQFMAKWNNSTLYAQTNLSAFGWTNLQFVVPATAARTTLEFDFNNDPGAFGLDDVTVQTYPGPLLTINPSGTSMVVTWPLSASSYSLFSATNPASLGAWTGVSQKPVTNGSQISVTLPHSGGETYYRLQK
jgi:hypothetical protein